MKKRNLLICLTLIFSFIFQTVRTLAISFDNKNIQEQKIQEKVYEINEYFSYTISNIEFTNKAVDIIFNIDNSAINKISVDEEIIYEKIIEENVENEREDIVNRQIEMNKNTNIEIKHSIEENKDYGIIVEYKNNIIESYSIGISNIDKESPEVSHEIIKADNKEIIIKIKCKDNLSGTQEIKLPDEEKVEANEIEYKIKKNGVYNFIATDMAGNSSVHSIEIDSLKKENLITNLANNIGSKKTLNMNTTYDFVKISTKYDFVLGLTENGEVYSWGNNSKAQLGIDNTKNQNMPQKVEELSNIVDISAGGDFSLALTENGEVYSWGSNSYGELGIGNNINQAVPKKINNLNNIIKVAASEHHAMAINKSGELYAWGSNDYGQLGIGNTKNQNAPQKNNNLINVVDISVGNLHSVALLQNGEVYSCGYNING